MRTTMYTPADTIVAAWIMALTGVGPSIASGSQTCSGNCELLPMVPMTSSTPISASGAAAEDRRFLFEQRIEHGVGLFRVSGFGFTSSRPRPRRERLVRPRQTAQT